MSTTRADEIIERQGQKIVKQAEQIQRLKGYVAELLAMFADEIGNMDYGPDFEDEMKRINAIEKAIEG